MIYVTGDTHGEFSRVWNLCHRMETTTDDVLIILGDAGINFHGPELDKQKKIYLRKQRITVFALQGNHDMRPTHLDSYQEMTWNGGLVYREEIYPNILFAKDGEIYDLNGLKTVVIGGAYSVDKPLRLRYGWPWFEDEQPSAEIREYAEQRLAQENWKVDIVLTHTCPAKYIPVETFISGVDQTTVDTGTEEWLEQIEEKLSYKRWYCGHYHTEKSIDRIRFMFKDIAALE